MNKLRDAANVRSDGRILIGKTVTCDGFAPERSIRIQTNINRLNDFSTSKGQQKKIVLSQETYEKLLEKSPDIKFRRGQFEVLPADGSCHTVENIQICLFSSGYMPGSVMPVVRTENGINVMYSSDISWSLNLSELSFPKVDVLVVDVKSDNIDSNTADFNGVVSLIKAVQPASVIIYSSQDGNASLLANYIEYIENNIENNIEIKASFDEQPVGLAWGGAEGTTTTSQYETKTTSVRSTSLKRLIVVVPSENQNAQSWKPLVEELKKETTLTDDSEWLLWDKHNLHDWSFQRGIRLSTDLKAKIDAKWQDKGSFDEVILIGHSLGGVLIRQTYLLASGRYPYYDESPWYRHVRRFVLFASLNRGFKPNQSLIWLMAMVFEKATFFSLRRLMPLQDFVKGSAFITNLRLNWIQHFSQSYYPLTVFQLLGAKDGKITRDDSVDLDQFPDAFHIDVPDAKHTNIHLIHQAEDIPERVKIIREAIFSQKPLGKNQNLEPSIAKNNVVFILHGIRASNSGWVDQLREKILQEYPDTVVITSSYGYFSAFNFVFPSLRQSNIAWFQDEYSYYFAKYPNIDFHFIGHSNGTYILGESLKRVSGMKFKRVYLAGSVLPREYPWKQIFDNKQVEKLCNARSSCDWPVGILCSGLQGVGMPDIGTGGFDGFLMGDERLKELYYFNGDHGKPLEESNHSNIIQYIFTGIISKPECLKSEAEISKQFSFFSRLSPWAMRCILLCLLFLLIYLGIFPDFLWVKLVIFLIIILMILVFLSVI